jgi:predicted nucleic-acid-binding protein
VSARRKPSSARALVDTNLFLRYLLDDLPEQADAVGTLLLAAAQGEVALVTNALVIAELVWTCESYYRLPRDRIADWVLSILNTPGLEVLEADALREAVLAYAARNVDFIDAWNVAWMKARGIDLVYTFDAKHYGRVEGIQTKAPGT